MAIRPDGTTVIVAPGNELERPNANAEAAKVKTVTYGGQKMQVRFAML
jgi:hypothetical protein